MQITISDKALEETIKKRKVLNKPDDWVFVLKLLAGGCAGFSYDVSFKDPNSLNKNEFKTFDYEGLTIYCDKKSYLFLLGTEIDWEDSMLMTGYKFNAPQVTSECGCGISVAF